MPRNKSSIRVAIISDLHAQELQSAAPSARGTNSAPTTQPEERRSHLILGQSETDPKQHPVAGLQEIIQKYDLNADILLCAGDIGDQARPSATRYAWEKVQEIAAAFSAASIYATAGNHDVDSRYSHNSHDARGALQQLTPPYPYDNQALNDQYWARHYVLHEQDHYRLLNLNSAAYHGGEPKEYKHGRITDATLAAIEGELQNSTSRPLNILLCHHHPLSCNPLDRSDYEVMRNGRRLLDMLGTGDYGRWLVIHGHKHYPRIAYDYGSATSAIILSAGSFSAVLYPELQTVARNQFYLVTVNTPEVEQHGLVGTVQAFEWSIGTGWQRATATKNFPAYCGFGSQEQPEALCNKVISALTDPITQWSAVQANVPQTQFLLPRDEENLIRALGERGYGVQRDEHGKVTQIAEQM